MKRIFKAIFSLVNLILLILALGSLIGGIIAVSLGHIWGFIILLVSICLFLMIIDAIKETLDGSCPECQKPYSKMSGSINYEYNMTDMKIGESSDGKKTLNRYVFEVCITCPECGNFHYFKYKIGAKNSSQADLSCKKHIRSLLRQNKK